MFQRNREESCMDSMLGGVEFCIDAELECHIESMLQSTSELKEEMGHLACEAWATSDSYFFVGSRALTLGVSNRMLQPMCWQTLLSPCGNGGER